MFTPTIFLRNLRSKNPVPDEPRYKIPYGGGFKWVTCPQYLGEILSFVGIAVMTWNLGAMFVLAITIGNLLPRAVVTHNWFKKKFDDYPRRTQGYYSLSVLIKALSLSAPSQYKACTSYST